MKKKLFVIGGIMLFGALTVCIALSLRGKDVFVVQEIEALTQNEGDLWGGTCCPQQGSICIYGQFAVKDYYFLNWDPCNGF